MADALSSCKLQGIFIHPSHNMSPSPIDESDVADLSHLDLEDVPDSPGSFASSLWSARTSRSSQSSIDYFSDHRQDGMRTSTTSTKLQDDDYLTTAFTSPPLASPGAGVSSAAMAPAMSSSASCNGGASMLRSVSLPVETFKQLEMRRQHLQAVSAAVVDQLAGSDQSSSSSSTMMRSTTNNSSFSHFAPRGPQPKSPFGKDWGAALPPREHESEPMVPFPYNLVTPKSPPRLMRSHSTSDVNPHLRSLATATTTTTTTDDTSSASSLSPSASPSTSLDHVSASAAASSSSTMPISISIAPRHRRPTWISPMTPIVGSPPTHDEPALMPVARPAMVPRVASYYA